MWASRGRGHMTEALLPPAGGDGPRYRADGCRVTVTEGGQSSGGWMFRNVTHVTDFHPHLGYTSIIETVMSWSPAPASAGWFLSQCEVCNHGT
jgi:hypothetical protein